MAALSNEATALIGRSNPDLAKQTPWRIENEQFPVTLSAIYYSETRDSIHVVVKFQDLNSATIETDILNLSEDYKNDRSPVVSTISRDLPQFNFWSVSDFLKMVGILLGAAVLISVVITGFTYLSRL